MKRAACSAVDGVGYLLEEHRGAADQERGDAALAPGGQVVANLVLGADQVDVLDHRGGDVRRGLVLAAGQRSEEHTSELQSLMRISYAVFCLKKKTKNNHRQAQH